ncbi:MAG: hypothetical protein KOO63_12675 [Bacteroidales bacterium]|nr:hypothetical protein [Candidatus Latescibacterota bacterium]
MKKKYITGSIETKGGEIPTVSTSIDRMDKWGAFKARCSIGRMRYTIRPGLYAAGNPDQDSIVLVSANYKLSFDVLRSSLHGIDAWILVLDTKGINVWCAAGKGTFGTDEIVNRIEQTRLKEIIGHRKLIVPQLGAPGVAAHEVKKHSGFTVIYGPVRASDILSFLENGMVATAEMRKVNFSMRDRSVLVPVEFVMGFKHLVLASVVFFLLAGLHKGGYSTQVALTAGSRSTLILLLAFLTGTIMVPMLLPWLPGRSFSLKGLIAGLILIVVLGVSGFAESNIIESLAWILIVTAISSFTAMNFTGASTYTSLSGVKKEMRIAVPLQITASLTGVTLWIIGRFV